MRKEGKSTRYALVCFYISSFAYSRARFKSFTRTFGKNFVFVLERGREKKISNPNRFFIASCRKDLKFPNLFAKAKNENESQESEDDSFHRSKTFCVFAFGGCSDSNLPPNERARFSRRVGFLFSLSVKSVKTRTAFLPDLGSVLTYFEGKKEEFWREKTTTKIHHHRFKRLHTTERDSSQISPLLTLSSNTRSSQDLFFLANTTRSITKKRRTRKEFVVAKEIAALALRYNSRVEKRKGCERKYGKGISKKRSKSARVASESVGEKKIETVFPH